MPSQLTTTGNPLIVRFQLFCDDTSGTPADERRIAEFVCSLTSLKLNVAPLLPLHVFVYTLKQFEDRLAEIVDSFDFPAYTMIDLANASDEEYAGTVRHCSVVDRFCIRRMLADFSLLPTDHYRLLIGSDIYFCNPPEELRTFYEGDRKAEVLYMVDDFTFGSELYKLTYHQGKMLDGLLGDFYCLSPGVALSREQITSCLTTIDSWEVQNRWDPHPDGFPKDFVHACEQQAAAILLSNFHAIKLPTSAYRHVPAPEKFGSELAASTVIHTHRPWALILRGGMPKALANEVLAQWKKFGMPTAVRDSKFPGAAFGIISRKFNTALSSFRGAFSRQKASL